MLLFLSCVADSSSTKFVQVIGFAFAIVSVYVWKLNILFKTGYGKQNASSEVQESALGMLIGTTSTTEPLEATPRPLGTPVAHFGSCVSLSNSST